MPRPVPGAVERPRLSSRLGTSPVTLVCGPAGSGKTTLLGQWTRAAGAPVGWVSLEADDDDKPADLWRAVLAALDAAGTLPEALRTPLDDDASQFTVRFLNALAASPTPITLVLDDVQVVRSRACRALLGALLTHLPRPHRVLLGARSDPVLPLHTLRVRTTLTEVRAHDLAFTTDETAELLAAHGLDVAPRLAEQLHERTEGWAAGLRMAAISLARCDDHAEFVERFAGDDRVVADYLLAEVLEAMTARERAFLLQTSIVDTISGPLADALTDGSEGQAMLSRLCSANGFVVALDGHDENFRYHRLFATLLRVRLHQTDPDGERACHRRAADWYARHRCAVEALRHAAAAGDPEAIAQVLREHWLDRYATGDREPLRAALAQLPPGFVANDSTVAAIAAIVAFADGDRASGRDRVADAERSGGASCGESNPALDLARLQRARDAGDLPGVLAVAEASFAGREAVGVEQVLVATAVGVTALATGDLERAERQLDFAVAAGRGGGADALTLEALGELALFRVLRDGSLAAASMLDEAESIVRRNGWWAAPTAIATQLALAASCLFERRLEAADAHLTRALVGPCDPRLLLVRRRLHCMLELARGDPDAAVRTLSGREPDHGPEAALRSRALLELGRGEEARAALEGFTGPEIALAQARLALVADDPSTALSALSRAECAALHAVRVEAAVVAALAHWRRGDRGTGLGAIERALALALAEQSGDRPSLTTGGPSLKDLLAERIRAGTSHRAIAGQALQILRASRSEPTRSVQQSLTPREREILGYLPTALASREIAAALDVSINTVKTHLRGLYRKLDADDRRNAVERARELNLIHVV